MGSMMRACVVCVAVSISIYNTRGDDRGLGLRGDERGRAPAGIKFTATATRQRRPAEQSRQTPASGGGQIEAAQRQSCTREADRAVRIKVLDPVNTDESTQLARVCQQRVQH
jgi:hypothetical protein